MILHFLKNSVFQKTGSLFQLIFRATQLQQRSKYDIFQNALLCTLASRTKRRSLCSRALFMKRFYFFLRKTNDFWSFNLFLKKGKVKGTFSDGKIICRLFHVSAQFLFTASKTELDYYQQKLNVRAASRVVERLKT